MKKAFRESNGDDPAAASPEFVRAMYRRSGKPANRPASQWRREDRQILIFALAITAIGAVIAALNLL